jgi:hypothetical protein
VKVSGPLGILPCCLPNLDTPWSFKWEKELTEWKTANDKERRGGSFLGRHGQSFGGNSDTVTSEERRTTRRRKVATAVDVIALNDLCLNELWKVVSRQGVRCNGRRDSDGEILIQAGNCM